jgi:hypothetical protein
MPPGKSLINRSLINKSLIKKSLIKKSLISSRQVAIHFGARSRSYQRHVVVIAPLQLAQ